MKKIYQTKIKIPKLKYRLLLYFILFFSMFSIGILVDITGPHPRRQFGERFIFSFDSSPYLNYDITYSYNHMSVRVRVKAEGSWIPTSQLIVQYEYNLFDRRIIRIPLTFDPLTNFSVGSIVTDEKMNFGFSQFNITINSTLYCDSLCHTILPVENSYYPFYMLGSVLTFTCIGELYSIPRIKRKRNAIAEHNNLIEKQNQENELKLKQIQTEHEHLLKDLKSDTEKMM